MYGSGPAAIQRMRMEVEGIGKDPATEKRRRSLGRSVSNLDQSGTTDAMQENSPENGRSSTREAQMLAERVVAMDEEMKMLKEALSKRNGELQSARLMCSKTATRLSVVEDELKKAKQQTGWHSLSFLFLFFPSLRLVLVCDVLLFARWSRISGGYVTLLYHSSDPCS